MGYYEMGATYGYFNICINGDKMISPAPVSFFDSISIGWIWYTVIVIIVLILIGTVALWQMMNYHMGKSLSMWFWGRVKRWSDSEYSVMMVLSLTNNISLDPARHELGGYTRIGEELRKYSPWKFWRNEVVQSLFTRPQTQIIPMSVYSINGVPTIPVMDLHPVLHNDIIKGLEKLQQDNIKTLPDYQERLDRFGNFEIIPGYTYRKWWELYSATAQKYTTKITVHDVLDLSGMCEHDWMYIESLESKAANQITKADTKDRYDKYFMIMLFLIVIYIVMKGVYLLFWAKEAVV